ncbi:MAG TPA: peptidoglycan-binding domain-containing protein, partial [Stellaceae bacterium]|nr:peptidoglycan-binding domain-containing protein [Stellaceae bacterium]
FYLASTPQKPLSLNGNNIIAWFGGGKSAPGMPRDLRPAEPAMHGADVAAVQAALADAHIKAPQNGSYDGATAAAVARFQKANGLDSNGVVDAVTRQKLGVKPAAEKGAN